MNDAIKAKLKLEYKKYQWYAETLGNLVHDAEDEFIAAYDAKDFRSMRKALGKMGNVLNSDAGAKVYRTWRTEN